MMTYRKGGTYRFSFVDGHAEAATYLGKNRDGMHRFALSTGEIWTGHTAPVSSEWS